LREKCRLGLQQLDCRSCRGSAAHLLVVAAEVADSQAVAYSDPNRFAVALTEFITLCIAVEVAGAVAFGVTFPIRVAFEFRNPEGFELSFSFIFATPFIVSFTIGEPEAFDNSGAVAIEHAAGNTHRRALT